MVVAISACFRGLKDVMGLTETEVWFLPNWNYREMVWRNSGMFNSFDGSAELDKHWTGHADGYEGMKVTLLVTELFFVPVVMDQLPEVNLGSGSDQRRQKHGDVQTCQMWCYGYFFGTLWVTL